MHKNLSGLRENIKHKIQTLLSFWPLVGASTSTTSTPLFVAALAAKAEKHSGRFDKNIFLFDEKHCDAQA